MIEIEGPDGVIYEFPAGTDDATMQRAMQQVYGAPQAPEQAPALQQFGPGMPEGQGFGNNLMQAVGQGGLFGFGDEVSARLNAMTGYDARTGSYGNWGTTYADQLAAVRGQQDQFAEAHPVVSTGAEIAGGVASSLAGGAALGLKAAPSLLGRIGQGAAVGAGEGALYGYGSGEGGVGDRLAEAGQGALFGGAVGAAAPAVIAGVGAALDPVTGTLASMRSGASPTRASQAIDTALQRSGRSVQQIDDAIRAAQAAGQPYTLADALGYSGQRALSGAVRTPGEARQQIVEFLASRQSGQGLRINNMLDDALNAPRGGVTGFAGQTAAQADEALRAARSAQAGTLYDAARQGAGPVDVRGVIAALDDRLGPISAAPVSGDGIDAAFSQIRNRLAVPDAKLPEGATAVELSDFNRVLGVKQDVQDMIGKAVRAGENNRARELGEIVRQLDSALEASSGGYRAANDTFKRASQVIDQIPAGQAAAGRGRFEDVNQAYAALSPEQQAAFRVGMSDKLMQNIDAAADGADKARPLSGTGMREKLEVMADDPQALADFLRRENDMFATRNAAVGGSATAQNLADSEAMSSEALGVIGNLLTGRFGAAASGAINKGVNALSGRNTATRDLIAQLLVSGDINAALAPALSASQRRAMSSAVVEALARASERGLTTP